MHLITFRGAMSHLFSSSDSLMMKIPGGRWLDCMWGDCVSDPQNEVVRMVLVICMVNNLPGYSMGEVWGRWQLEECFSTLAGDEIPGGPEKSPGPGQTQTS